MRCVWSVYYVEPYQIDTAGVLGNIDKAIVVSVIVEIFILIVLILQTFFIGTYVPRLSLLGLSVFTVSNVFNHQWGTLHTSNLNFISQ